MKKTLLHRLGQSNYQKISKSQAWPETDFCRDSYIPRVELLSLPCDDKHCQCVMRYHDIRQDATGG